jgi:quinol monooxygenase YgiN
MSNVTVGLWVPMEAKPGKEDEVAEFLTGAKPIVDAEPDTTAWFAIRMGPTSFGIFDVFENDAGRQAHLSGKVAAALMEKAPDLFATPPGIRQYDVLASKLPGEGMSITTLPTTPRSTASWASAVRSSGKRCSGSVVSAPAASAAWTPATAAASSSARTV